jgi:hypothetical protein
VSWDSTYRRVEESLREAASPRAAKMALEWVWRWQYEGLPPTVKATILDLCGPILGYTPERLEAVLQLSLIDLRRALSVKHKTALDILPKEPFPTTGWLGTWLLYAQGGEAPVGFTFWSGVATLAAALRRNFYWDRKKYYLYLNHYILLFGHTGIKKTTSMECSTDILHRLNDQLAEQPHLVSNQLFISPQRVTAERLVEMLAQARGHDLKAAATTGQTIIKQLDSVGLLMADELVTLLGKEVKGSERLIHFLTAVYGCPTTYATSTIARKDTSLRNVGLSVLFGSTEEWARTSITEDLFAGGFMARFILVHRAHRDILVPDPEPTDPVLANSIARWLIPWTTNPYPVELVRTEEATKWYQEWYEHNATQVVEPRLQGYMVRKHDHLHKLAGLLAISDQIGPGHGPEEAAPDSTLEVGLHYFKQALAILDWEETAAPMAFELIGTSDEARLVEYVMMRLVQLQAQHSRTKWLPHASLLRACRGRVGTAAKLRYLLETLEAEGRVELQWGRPAKVKLVSDSADTKLLQ